MSNGHDATKQQQRLVVRVQAGPRECGHIIQRMREVCMYICIHIHMYIHICIRTYIHMYVYIHMYESVCNIFIAMVGVNAA